MKQQEKKIIAYEVIKLIPFTTYPIGGRITKGNAMFEDSKNYPEFLKPIYESAKIMIGGDYEVKITPKKGCKIEKVFYKLDDIQILLNLMDSGQIKSLKVGCNGQYEVFKETISKIINAILTTTDGNS